MIWLALVLVLVVMWLVYTQWISVMFETYNLQFADTPGKLVIKRGGTGTITVKSKKYEITDVRLMNVSLDQGRLYFALSYKSTDTNNGVVPNEGTIRINGSNIQIGDALTGMYSQALIKLV